MQKKERGNNEIHHYCFKQKYNSDSALDKLKLYLQKNHIETDNDINLEDVSTDLVQLAQKFDEDDAESFGVGIIWVESYDQIPNILKQIRTVE